MAPDRSCGWVAKLRNSSLPPGPLVQREPLFNIPPVVIAVLAVLALIHAVRTFVFSEQQDIEFLLTFAFIPARYDSSVVLGGALPGGGADVWTFVTYALIHADWTHLGVNAIWLLAVRQRGCAPLRYVSLSRVFCRDLRRRAPPYIWPLMRASNFR